MPEVEEWVFDSVIQFLQSPLWTSQVMTFIDEHCLSFDVEDENKLVYTEVHEKFKELVEALLETHLQEMGVTPDQFASACAAGAGNKANEAVLNHILAVDDFLTFRKLMVKRNVELNHEALVMWNQKQEAAKSALQEGAAPEALDEDEEAQLREALRLSEEEYKRQAASGQSMAAEAQARLDEALKASATEAELAQAVAAKEQADLEHAIAMSLALEEERKPTVPTSGAAAPTGAASGSGVEKAGLPAVPQSDPVPPPPAKGLPPVPNAPIAAAGSPLPPVKGQSNAERLKEEQLRKLLASKGSAPATTIPEQDLADAKTRLEEQAKAKEAELKRIAEEHKAARVAEEARKAAAPAKAEPALPSGPPPAARSTQDEDLLRQRQAFLRAQRDKLVKAKAEERKKELAIYQAQKDRESGSASTAPDVSIPANYNPATDPANASQTKSPSSGMSEAEKKRMEMRLALARRMKMDMVEEEEARRFKDHSADLNQLEGQVRKVSKESDPQRRQVEEAALSEMQKEHERKLQLARVNDALARNQRVDEDDFKFQAN